MSFYRHFPKFILNLDRFFRAGILQIFHVELVTQIIHVSHLFIISLVKQQSLDSSERQFCCFFVFVAVEFFLLRTYKHLLPPPLPPSTHLYNPPPPPLTAYVLNGWSLVYYVSVTDVFKKKKNVLFLNKCNSFML